MKYLPLIITAFILQSCTSFRAGKKLERLQVDHCIDKQIESYDDLCAEESTGYEEMETWQAHRQGVKCASEAIKRCMELK